jgi:hypothetical protein
MIMTAISIRDLGLIAAYAVFLVVYFGCFFCGFRRALAGAAVVAGIVLIGLLPSAAALPALAAGFMALVGVAAYRHHKATLFTTSAAALLKDALAAPGVDCLPNGDAIEAA